MRFEINDALASTTILAVLAAWRDAGIRDVELVPLANPVHEEVTSVRPAPVPSPHRRATRRKGTRQEPARRSNTPPASWEALLRRQRRAVVILFREFAHTAGPHTSEALARTMVERGEPIPAREVGMVLAALRRRAAQYGLVVPFAYHKRAGHPGQWEWTGEPDSSGTTGGET